MWIVENALDVLPARACPYGVPVVTKGGYSEIDPAQCYGCGACSAVCPGKAIQLMNYADDMITSELNGLLERINYYE